MHFSAEIISTPHFSWVLRHQGLSSDTEIFTPHTVPVDEELILPYCKQQRCSGALPSTRLHLSLRQQLEVIKCLKLLFSKDLLLFPANTLLLFHIDTFCPFPLLQS